VHFPIMPGPSDERAKDASNLDKPIALFRLTWG
jgi:hypothetical protein